MVARFVTKTQLGLLMVASQQTACSQLQLQFITMVYAIDERKARRIDYLMEEVGVVLPRTVPCSLLRSSACRASPSAALLGAVLALCSGALT
jgi:hypothetical protein